MLTCATCAIAFVRSEHDMQNSKSGLQFCSRACKDKAQRIDGLKEIHPGHYGADKHATQIYVRRRGHQCEMCHNTEWLNRPIPLETHHIDGNPNNNKDTNLQLLCPNCHAFTPNYKGKNRKPKPKS